MRLDDYISEWDDRPFDWSSANCCHFSAGWVQSIEGRDPMASVEALDGLKGCFRVLADLGSLREAVTRLMGVSEALPAMAQIGDLVLLKGSHFGMLGICNGRDVAVLSTSTGVIFVNMDQAEASWPVGR